MRIEEKLIGKGIQMKRKTSLFIFMIFLLLMSVNSQASSVYDSENYDYSTKYYDENIRNYDVEIHVNKDASMEVTEKITVYAGGVEIRHGIYRDFPTEYNNKRVSLEVQEVLCDESGVQYSLENVDRGVRIKIGDADKNLTKGLHTYSIKYKTERQMAFYEDYDELYWNVIGSGWNFEIEQCHAEIYFPEGTKFLEDKLRTYTGKFGSRESSVEVYSNVWEYENSVSFDIYESLNKNEAFTVSVCFEKGAIDEPTFETKVRWFIEDNCISMVIFSLLLILIIWQYFVWKKHGKDLEAKIIIPKYYPPEGFEPADIKYIDKMGNTTNVLEATILNLAVKGFLKFSQKRKNANMIIEKTGKDNAETELTQNELIVYNKLKDKEVLKYSSTLQNKISLLNKHFSNDLKEKYAEKLFIRNDGYKVISTVLSIVIVIIAMIIGIRLNSYAAINALMYIFIAGFVSGFLVLIIEILKSMRKSMKKVGIMGKLPIIVFFALFFVGMIGGLTKIVITTFVSNIFVCCAIAALILDNYLFYQLIMRYTEDGQRVKEDIEGFKMFINTAKDDDFADKTPERFDKYFPYAYVLGLQNKWAEKFESVLNDAGYSPSWCNDTMMDHGRFNVIIFTNSFSSSFSSGMSSASTAPSSSGGSGGGGGFSGGGGGGRWPEVAGNAYYKSYTLQSITLFIYNSSCSSNIFNILFLALYY